MARLLRPMAIVCGWCEGATEPDRCSHCGRDPALPWFQRAAEHPRASEDHASGRPKLDPSQIRQKLRIAIKELGSDATKAQLAEHLGIDMRTLGRWQKVSG